MAKDGGLRVAKRQTVGGKGKKGKAPGRGTEGQREGRRDTEGEIEGLEGTE